MELAVDRQAGRQTGHILNTADPQELRQGELVVRAGGEAAGALHTLQVQVHALLDAGDGHALPFIKDHLARAPRNGKCFSICYIKLRICCIKLRIVYHLTS